MFLAQSSQAGAVFRQTAFIHWYLQWTGIHFCVAQIQFQELFG
jgi:hypothetical protein